MKNIKPQTGFFVCLAISIIAILLKVFHKLEILTDILFAISFILSIIIIITIIIIVKLLDHRRPTKL